eukprot:5929873-Prymnesium_polylepis.2
MRVARTLAIVLSAHCAATSGGTRPAAAAVLVEVELLAAQSALEVPEDTLGGGQNVRAPLLLSLEDDESVKLAEQTHPRLVLMLQSPFDHGCSMARPAFERLAKAWQNITFGLVDVGGAPLLAKRLRGASAQLPAYGLLLAGMSAPIRYEGGWSENSLGAWLLQQAELKAVELNDAADLEAMSQAHSVVVVALLTDKQKTRRSVEVAARTGQLQAPLAIGGEDLAAQLGAPFPSLLVMNRDGYPWPLRRAPLVLKAVEAFLRQRALPLVVPLGDSDRRFSRQVREHPAPLQVIVVHTSGARGVDL